jgi:LPXTG-motif cell wall-anchored protein
MVSALFIVHGAFATTLVDRDTTTKQFSLQLQDDTETPDGNLKSGTYSIRIADHLADRMIVEIHSNSGGVDKKFLAVPAKNLPTFSSVGPVIANGKKGKAAILGFSFSKDNVVEFVYPKKDAVALAKANGVTILAIDPDSEGMPAAPGMSAEDMKLVTLWTLTPTPIGPGNAKAGILAARYEPPTSPTTQHAEVRPPVLPRLPKTGSELPLLGLFGLCSLVFATYLSLRRFRLGSF